MERHQVSVLGRGSAAGLRRWLALAVLAAAAAVLGARPLHAQDATEAAPQLRSAAELDELVGPIALYADDLIAIVLPASTYPLQVVQAARFLDARAKDSTLEPNDDWDDSVVALLNYPEVVKKMNDDLDWTYDLGEAVLNQRSDVLDAVQRFRSRAYTSGNLRSDDKQVVANDDSEITIKPANPQVVYVPYYEPERVVVYQSAPVFYYYPYAYPVYYYPYPLGYSFYRGYFWGVTTAFVIGWHSHHLNVYHYGFAGHPYYGHVYHDPFYVRNDIHVNVTLSRSGGVWNPGPRRDGRPFVRSDDHYVRTPGAVRTGTARTPTGTARTPGVARAQNPNAAVRAEGRAPAGAATAGAAQNGAARGTQSGAAGGTQSGTARGTQGGERPSTAPSRSGTYRSQGQTNFAAPPAAPQRTTPGDSSARQRYSLPTQRYTAPSRGQAEQARPVTPPSRGNGGSYRSVAPTQPPSVARSTPPRVVAPAPSVNSAPQATFRESAPPQSRSPRSESRSSFAAPRQESRGAPERGGGGQGGSYRGHDGGGQSRAHESSRHGSR
jgi:hypothetical protein